jgi:hypothetical protein
VDIFNELAAKWASREKAKEAEDAGAKKERMLVMRYRGI